MPMDMKKIVVLTEAGINQESGIKIFRDAGRLKAIQFQELLLQKSTPEIQNQYWLFTMLSMENLKKYNNEQAVKISFICMGSLIKCVLITNEQEI